MASTAANLQLQAHRRQLLLISALAARRMAALARTADTRDIDGWWDRVARQAHGIVMTAAEASATFGSRFLRRHASLEGVDLAPVRAVPNLGQVSTSLRVMGPVAFKKHMALSGDPESSLRVMGSQLSGTAASRALDGDRETLMATFTERPQLVGYRRIARADACSFCLLLVSRGAVYSKESAHFQAHKPNCRCTAEPLYDHEDEPPEVEALRDQWREVTAGLSGKAALNAFRRARGG